MKAFTYQSHDQRVLFGLNSVTQLSAEAQRLGSSRPLLLCTPGQRASVERLADSLNLRPIGIFDRAMMHVPVSVAQSGVQEAARLSADCLVAIGGGSTTGLAKAIALESSLPIIAIPTTYAGSEMTTIYGFTDVNLKRTGKDLRVLPKTVIYDPELTLGLPVAMSVTSGLNAIAHAAEGLYAEDTNPVMMLLAEEGIRAMSTGLTQVVAEPQSPDVRSHCLYGAWLCGIVLGSVGVALHHKLCHTLGGTFNLPHAATHAVVLPHAIAYNASAAPEAMQRISRALGVPEAASGLFDLAQRLGAPTALRTLGLAESALDRAAELAVQNPYFNPRRITRAGVRDLLQRAFDGSPPVVGID